jgi:alkanesulfonate monooxygenase SsuD/methylene tetrahydromethanopterin reductase-like flavin-dependent oxidoreductase (luciferase family)
MDVYHFSEQPYHATWSESQQFDSLRVTLPNSYCDPVVAADLINQRLDEWVLCDELGINIMVNEHHSTATCMSASATIPLAMLARETKRVRLLALGFPIANRAEPLRLAEEIAYIDIVSRGRLEIGFTKGSPYEISPANSNPVKISDRFWDTHDLILKALTTHDGPFNWESEWHHFRQVNIWPRPYQQPRPEVWVAGGSMSTALAVADRGHRFATILGGWNAQKLFDGYRARRLELGQPFPGPDRFGYLALVGIGATAEEGHRRLHDVAGYFRTTSIVAEPFRNPPGYLPPAANAQWLKHSQGKAGEHFAPTTRDGRRLKVGSGFGGGEGVGAQDFIGSAIAFAGTPDQVYDQIVELDEHVGGIGNLLIMAHGGAMSHHDACENLRLFATEVLPRLKERDQSEAIARAQERVESQLQAKAA